MVPLLAPGIGHVVLLLAAAMGYDCPPGAASLGRSWPCQTEQPLVVRRQHDFQACITPTGSQLHGAMVTGQRSRRHHANGTSHVATVARASSHSTGSHSRCDCPCIATCSNLKLLHAKSISQSALVMRAAVGDLTLHRLWGDWNLGTIHAGYWPTYLS